MNAPGTRQPSGLTLIEVLMGTLIVGLVLVSASWAVSQASTGRHVHAESPINAALLAKELHELALTLPTAASGSGAAVKGSGVLALDSLDGAVFSPPIDSAKAQLTTAKGWIQKSSISVYALSDLAKPTSTKFAATGKSATSLYRLSVQVLDGTQDMGTWWWWINP